jgi:hypothetical protein
MVMMAIIGFVLRQPARHPDYPGLIFCDFVADTDFEITFTRIHGGEITFSFEAAPSVAGSA